MAADEPVWRDLITADETHALAPGIPSDLDRAPDVLVVGGGMVGVVTAVLCGRAGLGRVTLVERSSLGSGPSGRAAGILVPDGAEPAALVGLARASLALWHQLDEGWPSGLGLRPLDWLLAPPFRAGLLDDLPAHARHLTVDGLGRVEPALARPTDAVLLSGQARLNPLQVIARLSRAIDGVATGVEVTDVLVRGGRVAEVKSSAGALHPGVVIFTTGSEPKLPHLPLRIRCRQVKGHLLATEPAPFRLGVAGAGVPAQLENGSLLAGGTIDEGDLSQAVREEVIAAIRAELDQFLPAARGLGVSHQWCCFRPALPDNLPVVDAVPGLTNAWLTCGHYRSGLLMAPATAQALTQWIATGQRPDNVWPFRLSRFTDAPP